MIVADDETVVIGGLIDETNYGRASRKVPWLGDIPVLGWLFKTTDDKIRKTNLLVFLTPHIMRTGADHDARDDPQARGVLAGLRGCAPALATANASEADRMAEEAEANGVPARRTTAGTTRCARPCEISASATPSNRCGELEAADEGGARSRRRRPTQRRTEGGPSLRRARATFGDEGAATRRSSS